MSFDSQPLPHKIVIPSNLRVARQVEDRIIQEAEALDYSPQCAFAIRLALEETMVNAHKHGNGGDPDKQIVITYNIDRERATVRVRDEGSGFDPDSIPDPTVPDRISLPSGRGIMLMRVYLDEVVYNERGNEVQLVKERS